MRARARVCVCLCVCLCVCSFKKFVFFLELFLVRSYVYFKKITKMGLGKKTKNVCTAKNSNMHDFVIFLRIFI